MADPKIGRAVIEITVDDKQYKLSLDGIDKRSDETAKHVKSISETLNLAVWREFGQIVTGVVTTVAGALVSLTQRGAEVKGVDDAFSSLTATLGMTRDTMLETSRTATKGLITDFDLMAAGNKAMLLGLPVTAESLGTMAGAATVLGRAMKQDATKSFDDLITALGRGSPLILDNLGLTVKVSEANEAYARSLGKNVSELTEAEKKTAFYNAAMDAAKKKVAELGGIHLTLSDQVKVAQNTATNFLDRLGVGVNTSNVLSAGMASLGQSIQGAFGGNQKTAIASIMGMINDLAIGVTYVGQGAIAVATVFVTTWAAIKLVVLSVMTVIAGVGTAIVALVAGIAEMATYIPKVGKHVEGFAAGAKALRDSIGEVTVGLSEQAGQANQALAGNSELQRTLDGVSGAFALARDRMEEASGSTEKLTDKLKGPGPAADDAGKRTAEQAKAIADAMRNLENEVALGTKEGLDKRLAEIDIAHAAELLKIQELKGATAAEREQMVLLAGEKAQQQKNLAIAAGDETKNKLIAIQQEIALATMTSDDARIAQIEFNRQRDLAGLEVLKVESLAKYDAMVLAINEKYALLTATAQGHYANVTLAANAAGIQTQAQLQKTADDAVRLYDQMKASHQFTTEEMKKQWEKAEEAKRKAKGETAKYTMTSDQAIAQGAQQVLGVLGEKHKAAALAGAIIATYAAVAKALASAPWPASAVLAAGALAAGMANVAKIRSSNPGYKEGTPGLDFSNFGPVSLQALHGHEAVIPRGKGHLLAGEIAAEMGGSGGSEGLLMEVREMLRNLPAEVRRGMISGMEFSAR